MILSASSSPVLSYLSSDVYSDIGNTSENRGSISEEELMKSIVEDSLNSSIKMTIIIGVVSLIGDFIDYSFGGLFSTRALYNFKRKYFRTILSQELAWFDSTNTFEFSSKIQSQIEYIESGIGETFNCCLYEIFSSCLLFIFSYLGSWKLALVISSFLPVFIFLGIINKKINLKGNILVRQTWETAGGVGEEIYYNIKTVVSFSNFEYELKRFYEKVEISNKIELLVTLKLRLMTGLFYVINALIAFFQYFMEEH